MPIPEPATLLAGFVLAHAAWNVSDLPEGELLVPLAIVEKAGERRLMRFEAETQAEAIEKGKATMKKEQAEVEGWAFAREGLMPRGDKKVDVITVEVWVKGMTKPVSFIQQFRPYSTGDFRIVGPALLVLEGQIQEEKAAADSVDKLYIGVQTHSKAAPLWAEWIK